MHFRLRELASPSNPPLYPNIDISDDILSQSLSCFAKYVKSKYISSYSVTCNVKDCYTCDNSYIQIAYSSDIFVDALLSIQIYIGLVTLNSTDKQSDLEMSSLLMLPMFHTIGVIQD